MADHARPSDAHPRQRALHVGADDGVATNNSKISLTLRPAEFDDESQESPPATGSSTSSSASPHVGTSRQLRVHGYATPIRSTIKRRELVELAGNPFVDPHRPRADGQPSFRQDIYPAYDASGRRIGLEHVRNASVASETKGYYRKHVHEYDNARGAPLPLPSQTQQNRQTPQIPVQSSYPEQGPLPPVSAVIAGISPEPHYGVSSFSHIQNKPRSPHEILGLPPDAPLNLWSLLDPETPDAKPQYNYHVLVKLAILGNKGQKATLQDILRAIRMRFPYYDKLPKQEAIAFGNSIRHLLSLLAAFVREPKPVTEPGKGAYWRVDFSKGEGNKRVRKRNKPQKKSRNADKQENQDEKDEESERSGSEEPSPPSAQSSTQESSRSPTSQSPIESHNSPRTPKPRGGGKGGRKPAPKNLITTPNGGTAVVSTLPVEAPQNDFHARIDPALRDAPAPAPQSYGTAPQEPYLQLYPSSVGAHRERPVRGAARSAPYPSTLAIPKDSTRHAPEGNSQRYASDSPVDMRYRNEHHSAMSQSSGDAYLPHEYQRNHHSVSAPSVLGGYDQNGYAPHHSFNSGGYRDDASSKGSSSSDQHTSPNYSEQRSQPSSANSHYSNRFSHSPTTYQMTPSSAASYGPPPLSIPIPSSAGSAQGPSSSVSSGGSYGIPPHLEHRPASETDSLFNGVNQPRTDYHEDESRGGSVSWNSARSTPHPVELSARF